MAGSAGNITLLPSLCGSYGSRAVVITWPRYPTMRSATPVIYRLAPAALPTARCLKAPAASRTRGATATARALPSFPTKGPLSGAILGGTFLGPVGAVLGYMGMLGVEKVKGKDKQAEEEEEEEVFDSGVTPELLDMAKDLANQLEEGEVTWRACAEAAAKSREVVSALGAEVAEARRGASEARSLDNNAKMEALSALQAERHEQLQDAEAELLDAAVRLRDSEVALERLQRRALQLDSRMQRSMAITRARLAGSPIHKTGRLDDSAKDT